MIFSTHHSTTYVDAAYYYRPSSVLCLSVGRSDTIASPAKTAEAIEMPIVMSTQVGPGQYVLDGVLFPHGKGQF